VAALVVYGLGAYLVGGDRTVAVALGGAVALLLHWKDPLHGFVRKMGDRDMSAIMRFVLIALVILPVLPKRNYGPYETLNPFETWLVVVLVVGMSLAGYVLYKFVPPQAGALIGGAVGGLISSTATTVSFARRTASEPAAAALAAQAIMVANTVSVLRVVLLVFLFAGVSAWDMWLPLAAVAGVLVVVTGAAFGLGRGPADARVEQGNPAELKAALIFGGLYAAVKLATAWGRATFGASALYVVGALSGLTDMDAITLSISDMTRTGQATPGAGWRVIVVAILANLVFKGACVMALGSGRLKGWVAGLFGAALAGGVAVLLLLPRWVG
jgi:uncharacterized membrane protein (DUF4010 family)